MAPSAVFYLESLTCRTILRPRAAILPNAVDPASPLEIKKPASNSVRRRLSRITIDCYFLNSGWSSFPRDNK